MPRYGVVTPEFEVYGGSYDPPEPAEFGRDYLEIEAPTTTEAKVLAVRIWRAKNNRTYVRQQAELDACPFTGIKAERVP